MATSLAGGIVRSLRPHQWTKNALVFAAPVAAGRIDEWATASRTLVAFVAFCMAASGTYLLNDARDVEADRLHPTKRNRPMAAGIVPVPLGYALGVVLLLASLAVGALVDRNLAITIAAYLVLTTAYTLRLKNIPVYDIVAVATGFVLRAIAGAAATSVPISEWFFIVTSFGALLMVVGKREGELMSLGADAATVRPTLAAYKPGYLLYLRAVASGVVLIGYCLWSFETATRVGVSPDAVLWYRLSVLPFTIAILRYAMLLDAGEGSEPERLIFSDRGLLLAGACWALIYGYGTYVA